MFHFAFLLIKPRLLENPVIARVDAERQGSLLRYGQRRMRHILVRAIVLASIVLAVDRSLLSAPARRQDIGYAPTPPAVVDAMLQAAGVTANDVVYDLGSGDGRVVIMAAAKYGARGVGIEIDPALVKSA